ncbi:MAG: HD domain-containing protein [Bacteroidales bacterium]|nr:HD domain-containing protein [Bacteroidales bacterium]
MPECFSLTPIRQFLALNLEYIRIYINLVRKILSLETNNKKKIINDPVYGFIQIPSDTVYDLVEHPYFQRLRRIKQLGLAHLVYPGAMHTRFQHALGAMHLMSKALDLLRKKGHEISDDEYQAAIYAILLHDIGHGPFSHALENSIVHTTSHEQLSLYFMEELNRQFGNQLDLAIAIFTGKYSKPFLHQLVSGHIDVDRLDYLKRDSFFTGVSEGVVGSDRIINMMNVVDGELVVEEKGVFSIEKFLFARRFMYWQVYLHKAVVSAESVLLLALRRARYLSRQGVELPASGAFRYFLREEINPDDFHRKEAVYKGKNRLELFAALDDNDIVTAVKEWSLHEDKILSFLSSSIMNRKLFNIQIQEHAFSDIYLDNLKNELILDGRFTEEEAEFLVLHDSIHNYAYSLDDSSIHILKQNGQVENLFDSSDVLHSQQLSKGSKKFFVIYPR